MFEDLIQKLWREQATGDTWRVLAEALERLDAAKFRQSGLFPTWEEWKQLQEINTSQPSSWYMCGECGRACDAVVYDPQGNLMSGCCCASVVRRYSKTGQQTT